MGVTQMNRRFLAVCLASLSAISVVANPDPFKDKFGYLLGKDWARYKDGELDIVQWYAFRDGEELPFLSMCGGMVIASCALMAESQMTQACLAVTGIGLGVLGFKKLAELPVHWQTRLVCTFDKEGLSMRGSYVFRWSQMESFTIQEVYRDEWHTKFEAADAHFPEWNNHRVRGEERKYMEKKYLGRCLIVHGKHNSRLWAIDENNMPGKLDFNTFIDLLEFYHTTYKKA
jgi:hypothetical protein